jgi:hypothetical protein
MRLHAEQGFRGEVIDLDTGRTVPKVIWLDEELGELEAYQLGPGGEYCFDASGENYVTIKLKGRFKYKYIPANPLLLSPRKSPVMGAPRCTKCSNPLTLPGDDLCPPCRAKERNQRHSMRAERITNPLERRRCSAYACGREANWSVSDEVEVTPEPGSIFLGGSNRRTRVLFDRGMTVGRRYYCSFHYQSPRILDARGEVIETLNEAHGVRPN